MKDKKILFSLILLSSSYFGIKGSILDNPLEPKIWLKIKLRIAWRNIKDPALKSRLKNIHNTIQHRQCIDEKDLTLINNLTPQSCWTSDRLGDPELPGIILLGRYASRKYDKIKDIEAYKKNKESKIVNNVTLGAASLGAFFFTTFFNSDTTTTKNFLASAACACGSAYFFSKAHTAYRKKDMHLIKLQSNAKNNKESLAKSLNGVSQDFNVTTLDHLLFPQPIGIDE